MEMMDPWLPILRKLPLTRTELAVVKRYTADPLGRTFLPVADILRNHKLVDESVELLMQGVERHPNFTVARVVLARELLAKGMAEESWATLEGASEPLHDNVLAQKIRLKLAVVLGHESRARETFAHIKMHRMFDDDALRLGEALEVMKFSAAREMLIRDLRKTGVPLMFEGEGGTAPIAPTSALAPAVTALATVSPPQGVDAERREETDNRMDGFHVVPLREIFAAALEQEGAGPMIPGGVELDSLTLAEIYQRQGHFQKALEVNRRLLRLMPNSELLKRRIAELGRLKDEQRTQDLAIDPAIVDKMETIQIIDSQLKFLNDFLNKL